MAIHGYTKHYTEKASPVAKTESLESCVITA